MTGALGMIGDNPKQAAQVIASIGSVLNSGSSSGSVRSVFLFFAVRKVLINHFR